MKKITDKQAVKAVKILSKYCKKHSDNCGNCIFNYPIYENDETFCNMNFTFSPEMWDIKEVKRIKNENNAKRNQRSR